jgi:hypothetical protein
VDDTGGTEFEDADSSNDEYIEAKSGDRGIDKPGELVVDGVVTLAGADSRPKSVSYSDSFFEMLARCAKLV